MRWMIAAVVVGVASACGAPAEGPATAVDGQAAAHDRVEMTVAGLECPLCARALERQLTTIEGSRGFEIDLGGERSGSTSQRAIA